MSTSLCGLLRRAATCPRPAEGWTSPWQRGRRCPTRRPSSPPAPPGCRRQRARRRQSACRCLRSEALPEGCRQGSRGRGPAQGQDPQTASFDRPPSEASSADDPRHTSPELPPSMDPQILGPAPARASSAASGRGRRRRPFPEAGASRVSWGSTARGGCQPLASGRPPWASAARACRLGRRRSRTRRPSPSACPACPARPRRAAAPPAAQPAGPAVWPAPHQSRRPLLQVAEGHYRRFAPRGFPPRWPVESRGSRAADRPGNNRRWGRARAPT
mmetsp:Transcript_77504/g.203470  ORF Transcript_77504/g.203470 Transcript_77504/m.203470 type:complete len:273 (-) Transcript_77504:588-1406(-)